jgi:hypothetical protein
MKISERSKLILDKWCSSKCSLSKSKYSRYLFSELNTCILFQHADFYFEFQNLQKHIRIRICIRHQIFIFIYILFHFEFFSHPSPYILSFCFLLLLVSHSCLWVKFLNQAYSCSKNKKVRANTTIRTFIDIQTGTRYLFKLMEN